MSIKLKDELKLATETEVAELRGGITIAYLRNERSLGRGPVWTKIGNTVFYPIDDLKKFLATNTVRPQQARTMIHSKRTRTKTQTAAT